jgi:hypothetical protein
MKNEIEIAKVVRIARVILGTDDPRYRRLVDAIRRESQPREHYLRGPRLYCGVR